MYNDYKTPGYKKLYLDKKNAKISEMSHTDASEGENHLVFLCVFFLVF